MADLDRREEETEVAHSRRTWHNSQTVRSKRIVHQGEMSRSTGQATYRKQVQEVVGNRLLGEAW